MVSEIKSDSEDKILEAAKKVFIEKGLEGARMQEIANEARINKSLLHYYFRSKEKLFNAVFRFALSKFVPRFTENLKAEMDFYKRLEIIIEQYISLLLMNQFIPIFILNEINRNPDRIFEHFSKAGVKPEIFIDIIQKEIDKGTIKPIDPRQLIINMLALCIFPIAARPLLKRVFFDNNKKAYKEFLLERKTEVYKFIIESIKP